MSLLDAVQSRGPAILLPAEAIGNVVTKTNILINSHRDFLANLDQRDVDTTRTTVSVITPPPSLNPREASPLPQLSNGVLPECGPAVSSAQNAGAASVAILTSSLASVSSTGAASIATLQGLLQSANIALTSATNARNSIQSSASLAIISANSTASSALTVSSSAVSSLSSISSSASSAISSVSASAGAAIASAQSALSSIQSSANAAAISLNSAVASANAVASNAQATATFAIAQAQASVSSLSQQASASITANRIAAMNTTKFALAITFAILGSSIISILAYYLISRFRQRRRERRQLALKERIMRVRNSGDSQDGGPSLSEFPMPVGRTAWSRGNSRGKSLDERRTWNRDGGDARSTMSTEMPIQGPRRFTTNVPETPAMVQRSSQFPFPGPSSAGRAKTWSPRDESRTVTANGMDEDGNTVLGSGNPLQRERQSEMVMRGGGQNDTPTRQGLVRKNTYNTLTYDPEHPERPPKFTTWLEDSFRSVSPFPVVEQVPRGQGQVQRRSLNPFRRSVAPPPLNVGNGGAGKGGNGIGTAI
ncbi:uncharacterized protein PAC_18249 [Phialocephala subalpina]|uniref:Uncharacterized protein n=1 Tax=Phialocephala subalpina TaxID=576137 RepID=A0A1L7XTJ1_9HELO|nr:uncharacterized protein PAC_18249 [Phialocephala subalpina]